MHSKTTAAEICIEPSHQVLLVATVAQLHIFQACPQRLFRHLLGLDEEGFREFRRLLDQRCGCGLQTRRRRLLGSEPNEIANRYGQDDDQDLHHEVADLADPSRGGIFNLDERTLAGHDGEVEAPRMSRRSKKLEPEGLRS